MDSNSPPHRRKARPDLVHLRSLLSVAPATATGQVTAAWGEIEAGLARGMKLRQVWEAAKLDGLEIPYPQFRVYVSRMRRRQRRSSTPQLPLVPTNVEQSLPNPPPDPFRNLREQREKKKQSIFEYDPFSINKNLIGWMRQNDKPADKHNRNSGLWSRRRAPRMRRAVSARPARFGIQARRFGRSMEDVGTRD